MPYVLYYHSACKGFTGRAAAALMMLEQAGAEFEIKLPDAVPAPTGFAPPMMSFPDGSYIAQTSAICIALGQDLGLAPKDPAAARKAMQITCDAADVISDMSKGEERLAKWLSHLETNLSAACFCGDNVTYADFAVYQSVLCLDIKSTVDLPKMLEAAPKLSKWCAMMKDTDGAKKVAATGVPILPESMR